MAQRELVALLVERGYEAREIRTTSAGCSRSKADDPCCKPECVEMTIATTWSSPARLRVDAR